MAETQLEKARKTLAAFFKKQGRGAAAALARECGVDLSLPWRWARGEKTPDADTPSREVIERIVGIPRDDWRKPKRRSAPRRAA